MVDRLKQIPSRLVEMWKNLSTKQRMLIISVFAVVLMTFIVLYYVLSRVNYTTLYKFQDTSSASEMINMLKDNNITCKLEADNLTVDVDTDSYQDAVVLMGTSDIPDSGMSWEEALNNSISTGQKEKDQKINLALQNDIRSNLLKLNYVKDAAVYIQAASNDSTIFFGK